MILTFVYVIYALVAVAMIALILMQRGAGAAAGSGFGGGASATVFGARGSSNFLSKATKWLAVVFFTIALGLAIYASKPHAAGPAATDLGVIGALRTAPAGNAQPPTAPPPQGNTVPAVPTQSVPAPVTGSTVPAVPASQPAAPAPAHKGG
jgi:preprotein translocase subunit SecG